MQSDPSRGQGLLRPVQFLKGVGPRRAADLARLGIETVEDLVLHFPRDYLDLGDVRPIAELTPGERATVQGQVLASAERRPRRGLSLLQVMVDDGTGRLQLVFFNQPYLKRQLRNGARVAVNGELAVYRSGLQMQSPELEILGEDESPRLLARTLLPLYPLTRGVGQRWLRRLTDRVLAEADLPSLLPEVLPAEWLAAEDWPRRAEALQSIHFPEDQADLARARERLKFEELFLLQLLGALRRHRRRAEHGPVLDQDTRYLKPLLARLPFQLTHAQSRALGEIRADLSSGGRMNRLLQGDVGCGKTVVALAASLLAVEGGYQAAFMVPLEALARQHFASWAGRLAALGLRCGLLLGSGAQPAAERRATIAALAAGEIDLVFGTHALIQEGVAFARLGLAVVDEQHRFGVMQRAGLRERGAPHVLVMTATPIPRSLAMTVYGDLELSVIDELPPGRPPLVTTLRDEARLPQIYAFLRERVEAGERAFLIYPLVEEGDQSELKAATEAFEELEAGPLAGLGCALIHGRLSPARKAEALDAFRSGERPVLVATTVVEVGIDVPEATLMLIHNPERFGLSQLHQLRGRIGRGTAKSYCVLVASGGLGPQARERLEIFVKHRDGFKLAEEDLRLRGPGELFGQRQHGRPELSLAHPLRDARLVALARERAVDLAQRDPELAAADLKPLRALLQRVYKERLTLAGVG
ncbi:MAG: ATP-dependent DNA helicase RecG [Candidatus Krumholzibacteriia bacterium]